MKKKYIAPQFTSLEMFSEHSMMLTASNVQGNGIQLSNRRDEFVDGSEENWNELPWKE